MNDQLQRYLSLDFEQLATASDELLSSCDIAALNLIAAHGLPGTEGMDMADVLAKLDGWAERVKAETMRHLYRFDSKAAMPPSEFN